MCMVDLGRKCSGIGGNRREHSIIFELVVGLQILCFVPSPFYSLRNLHLAIETMLQEKGHATEEQIQQRILESKRLASSAMEYGVATMESLEAQDEMLQEVEDKLEANEYVIQKSVRALRGMTWGGYFVNKVVDVRNSVVGDPHLAAVKQANEEKQQTVVSNGHAANMSKLMEFGQKADRTDEDKDLAEISSAVEVLHKMGLTLGEQLDQQNTALDRIENKTSSVTEQTLAVTIRASQLLRSSHNTIQSFVGTYQFLDVQFDRYLTVSNNDGCSLALSETPDSSSYWHCFVKEESLFGLLNEKTQKYLGCTVWGNASVLGNYFGTHEECYVDFQGVYPAKEGTGILIIYKNWGAGGWLRLDASVNTQDRRTEWLVLDATSSILDKTNALQFKCIKTRVKPDGAKSVD